VEALDERREIAACPAQAACPAYTSIASSTAPRSRSRLQRPDGDDTELDEQSLRATREPALLA